MDGDTPMGERFEPYSVREMRKRKAGQPVIYQYDKIPSPLRAPVMVCLRHASLIAGRTGPYWATLESHISAVHNHIKGLWSYGDQTHEDAIVGYVERVRKVELFLDVVEIGLYIAYQFASEKHYKRERDKAHEQLRSLVSDVNYYFSLHGMGFTYIGEPGTFIRVDTQFIHREVVEPAVMQLYEAGWKGPEDEFLSAHRHYRRGEHKQAMNDALKSFESTMKAVLTDRAVEYDPNGNASYLILTLINNGIIHPSLEPFMNGLKQVLTSGVPTLRNKLSGHGQGPDVRNVPDYVAAFTLNLTASNIVFLTEANAAFAKKQ